MLVTGESIDAAAAVQRGLINRCVPADRSIRRSTSSRLAIVAKPQSVIATGKALFYRQLELGVVPAYQLAGQSMACNMMDDIAQEGFRLSSRSAPRTGAPTAPDDVANSHIAGGNSGICFGARVL